MATIAASTLGAETADARAPKPAIIWAFGLAGAAAAATSLALALTNDVIGAELGEPLVAALLLDWITVSYVLCGLVAWSRRPASRFGPLMLAAGFVNFLATLSWSTVGVVYSFGQALDLVVPVLFLHVFLAFPSGRLKQRAERTVIAAAYTTAVSLELVRMMLGGFGPDNLLELTQRPGAAEWVARVQVLSVGIACLWGVIVLILRRRRTGRPLRRSLDLLVDSFMFGLVMIGFLFILLVVDGPWTAEIRWATLATLGLAPIAFLVGLLQARLAHSALADLLLALRAEPGPEDLRDALSRALRDPSLSLAYWLPEFDSWADPDGRAVELPQRGDRRGTTLIEREGKPVAVLLHDPALSDERELLDAVRAVAAISLENGRLHAELKARLQELKGSRARIVEAGQKERQRLERNLHDGAQQRLVALLLDLSLLEGQLADDPTAKARLDGARREIAASLEELRELARGLHPAIVSGHGLSVALEQLAARAPVPVKLTVETGGRLPESLEMAAYYMVCESLANIGKYANASSATIEVIRIDGQVVVEVVDDGIGGADPERGSGLRGLADRVEALDGRLRVWSPSGGGTRVRAELPCAS